ncbi:hypothetical protein TNCV_1859271 [Trichonephila clavipes]|nr:hypothetical protein TNCV_1859271 [Trichonephila clavipes]
MAEAAKKQNKTHLTSPKRPPPAHTEESSSSPQLKANPHQRSPHPKLGSHPRPLGRCPRHFPRIQVRKPLLKTLLR